MVRKKKKEKNRNWWEDRFNQLANNVSEPIINVDWKGKILFVNSSAASYFRKQVSSIIGKSMWELFPKKIADRQVASVRKVFRIKKRLSLNVESEIKGEKIYFDCVLCPLFDLQGRVCCVQIFAKDVSLKNRFELQVLQSNSFLNQIGKVVKLGGWEVDLENRIVIWTKPTKLIHEVPLEYVPALDEAINFFAPESKPKIKKAVNDAIKKGKPYDLELELITAKGNRKIIRTLCKPEFKKGKCVRLWGTIQDITEEKQKEEKVKKSELRLRTILDSTPFPVAVVDDNDQYISYWSKSAQKLFGHTPNKVLDWYNVAYPDKKYRSKIIKHWKSELKKHRNLKDSFYAGEYNITCKDGSVKICDIYALFLDENLIVTFNDVTDKKVAENKIKEVNNETRLTLNATTQGIWKWNFKTNEMFFSDTYYKILGYKPGAFKASFKKWLSLIHPDDKKKTLAVANEFLKTKPDNYENIFRMRCKDGSYKWIRSKAKVVERDKKGDAIRMIGSHEDITERKKAEQDLKRIFEFSESLICIADLKNTQFLKVNPAFKKTLGYTEDKIIGKSFMDFIHPDDRDATLDVIKKDLLKGKEVFRFQNRYRCKDGSYKVFDWESHPILKEGLTYAIAKDITERKKVEEKLIENEEKYRNVINGSSIPTFLLDKDHKVTHWNKACEILTGVKAKNILGTKKQSFPFYAKKRPVLSDLVIGGAKKSLIKKYYGDKVKPSEILKGCYEGLDFFPTLGKEGLWLLFTSSPLKDSNGKIIGAVENLHDITNLKKTQQELEESEKLFKNLYELSMTLKGDTKNILREICKKVHDVFGGFFVLVNHADAGEFNFKSGCNLPREVLDLGKEPIKGAVCSHVLETKDALFTDKLQHGRCPSCGIKYNKDGAVNAFALNTYVGAPLVFSDGSIHGTLCIVYKEKQKPFSKKQMNILKLFARRVAIELEREEFSKRIVAAEKNFTNIVEKSRQGIIVVDKLGKVLYINPFGVRILRRKEKEILGADFGLPLVEKPTEVNMVLPGGRKSVAEMTTTPTMWKGKKATLVLLYDISERKISEEKLKQTMEEMRNFNKIVVGRELKMMELKEKIELLESKLDHKTDDINKKDKHTKKGGKSR